MGNFFQKETLTPQAKVTRSQAKKSTIVSWVFGFYVDTEKRGSWVLLGKKVGSWSFLVSSPPSAVQ